MTSPTTCRPCQSGYCIYQASVLAARYVACKHQTLIHCNKWNDSGFRAPLCTYRLNWASRTSWGWWDEWDDTVIQTQDSKFEPWRSEAEHVTSRSRRLPTILTLTRWWGRNIFSFFQTAESGNRTPNSGVRGSDANHYPRAPARFIVVLRDVGPAMDLTLSTSGACWV